MSENILDHSQTMQNVGTLPIANKESGSIIPLQEVVVAFAPIIWTPRFIKLFVSLLVLGLSLASIMTQLWLNGIVRIETIFLLCTAFVLGSSLLIIYRVQNIWIRTGGILTALWCLLLGLHFAIPMVSQLDPHTTLLAHLDIATQSAFLGAAVCFSVAHTPLRRWDNWFFCCLPFIGIVFVVLNVLLTPTDLPSGSFNESMIVTALLYLGVVIWWFRPVNWKVQPGVTFFLGANPLLQILFTTSGYHQDNVAAFITQVILLFFFLVNLRILQGEQRLFTKSRKNLNVVQS